jgi:serine/threonine protein kinase
MSESSPSRRVGKYRVLKELGRGSFGITSLAEHVSLGTRVVLKEMIASAVGDRTVRDRFIQEARIQAKLSAQHQGIAQVTELEEDSTPPYYIVENCDLGDLATLVEQMGPFTVGHVVWVIRQVADALSCVHQEVWHRDIKPHNLVLANSYRASGEPMLKIIDFGLARLRGVQTADNPMMTKAGQMLGTVLFSAPEQLRNDESLDGRCDLFSLGMTAWFLLEGRPPLRGNSGQILSERLSSEGYGDALPSTLPPSVRRLLERLLAKDPAQRPATAKEVVLEADRCLSELCFVWEPITKRQRMVSIGGRNIPSIYDINLNSGITDDSWGQSMLATVRSDHRHVQLRVFRQVDAGTFARLSQAAGRIREAQCLYLPQMRVENLDEGVVVEEELLMGSSDIMEVIRETHAQNLPQAVRLLRAIADACDAVKMVDLPQFPITLKSVELTVAARRFRDLIPQGKFQLRLRSDFSIFLPDYQAKSRMSDSEGTLTGTLAGDADSSMLSVPQRFLRIVYWVLAGREPRPTAYWCAADCDPIRGLNEESNVIIKRYLAASPLPEEYPCGYLLELICHAQGVAFPASEESSQITYKGSSVRTAPSTGSSGGIRPPSHAGPQPGSGVVLPEPPPVSLPRHPTPPPLDLNPIRPPELPPIPVKPRPIAAPVVTKQPAAQPAPKPVKAAKVVPLTRPPVQTVSENRNTPVLAIAISIGVIGVAALIYALVLFVSARPQEVTKPDVIVAPPPTPTPKPDPTPATPKPEPPKEVVKPTPVPVPDPKPVPPPTPPPPPKPTFIKLTSPPQVSNLTVTFGGKRYDPQSKDGSWILAMAPPSENITIQVAAVGYVSKAINLPANATSLELPQLMRNKEVMAFTFTGGDCDYEFAELKWLGAKPDETGVMQPTMDPIKAPLQDALTRVEVPSGKYQITLSSSKSYIEPRMMGNAETATDANPYALPKSWHGKAVFNLKTVIKSAEEWKNVINLDLKRSSPNQGVWTSKHDDSPAPDPNVPVFKFKLLSSGDVTFSIGPAAGDAKGVPVSVKISKKEGSDGLIKVSAETEGKSTAPVDTTPVEGTWFPAPSSNTK